MNTGPFATKTVARPRNFTTLPPVGGAPRRFKIPSVVPLSAVPSAPVPMLPPSGSGGAPCVSCGGKGKVMTTTSGSSPMSCNRCGGSGKMGAL